MPDIVGFGHGRGAAEAHSSWPLRPAAFIVIAIVLVAGGTGAAAWLLGGHKPAPAAGSALGGPSPSTPPDTSAPSEFPSSSPLPSSSADPGQSLVTVTDTAKQDAQASPVAAFADKYFTAINSHNYYAYRALFVPRLRQGLTPAGFDRGFDGTNDSGITLVSISTAIDGDIQADLEFTSNQNPDAANNQESCTSWSISLFLAQGDGGYLIDVAPSDYHAVSAPC